MPRTINHKTLQDPRQHNRKINREEGFIHDLEPQAEEGVRVGKSEVYIEPQSLNTFMNDASEGVNRE